MLREIEKKKKITEIEVRNLDDVTMDSDDDRVQEVPTLAHII